MRWFSARLRTAFCYEEDCSMAVVVLSEDRLSLAGGDDVSENSLHPWTSFHGTATRKAMDRRRMEDRRIASSLQCRQDNNGHAAIFFTAKCNRRSLALKPTQGHRKHNLHIRWITQEKKRRLFGLQEQYFFMYFLSLWSLHR